MLRRIVVAALVVSSLALPRGAAAAEGDGVPLGTFCNSPTGEYCMSFLTYDIVHLEWSSQWSSVIRVFGSGYETAGAIATHVEVYARRGSDCAIWLSGFTAVDGPGDYTLGDVSGGCVSDELPPQPNLDDDLRYIAFNTSDRAEACSPSGAYGRLPCHHVPEPASLLLLATGLGGIGFVGWRRRRAA